MKPSDISLSVLSISIAHILPNKHIIAVVREGYAIFIKENIHSLFFFDKIQIT